MNGEDFYAEFKEILNQLGVGWRGMKQVNVEGRLVFTLCDNGKKVTVELDLKEEK